MKKLLVALLCIVGATPALAADACKVEGAQITYIGQSSDGMVFVYFDRATDCACSQPHRMAFHRSHEPFMAELALVAFENAKAVNAYAIETGCEVHGNSARLNGLFVGR